MKKKLTLLMTMVFIIFCFGCSTSQQPAGGVKACEGYFDISAKDFLAKLNGNIKEKADQYPELPEYTDVKQNGFLMDCYSQFDDGASLRVTENSSKKVVEIAVLIDITRATKTGVNYSGYYFAMIGLTIDPSMTDGLKAIKETNLAMNNVQTASETNFFCVAINEDRTSRYQFYPLAKN